MNIFLTLDYELFSSNRAGTPDCCIIKPMDALSEVAARYGVHYTIFVDAAYVYRLSQLRGDYPEIEHDFDLITNHLQKLVSEGHDIQLHFHPQWIYTRWCAEKQEWDMDINHFKLSDMEYDMAISSFFESKNLLDGIIGYQTNCFRACGYCLDTFKDYTLLFRDNGITKDSSVVRHCYADSLVHKYDYRDVPSDTIYRFEESVKVKTEKGQFTEISISTFHFNPLSYVMAMRRAIANYEAGYVYKDGAPLPDKDNSRLETFLNRLRPKQLIASLDGINSQLLQKYYDIALKFGQKELVICGHPKNATEGSINNLNAFLSQHQATDSFLTSRDI